MRKLIVLFALLCATVGIGAIPATASAAVCTAQEGFTYWDGQLAFSANLVNCSGIDAVQFRNATQPGGMSSGWVDISNFNKRWQATSPTGDVQIGGPNMTGASLVYHRPSWCGGATHQIQTDYYFRIHNSAGGGSWGQWYHRFGPGYLIWC